jgi:hypothetical protein
MAGGFVIPRMGRGLETLEQKRSKKGFISPDELILSVGKHLQRAIKEEGPKIFSGEETLVPGLNLEPFKKHLVKPISKLVSPVVEPYGKVIMDAYTELFGETEEEKRKREQATIDIPEKLEEFYDIETEQMVPVTPALKARTMVSETGALVPSPPLPGETKEDRSILERYMRSENLPEAMEQRRVDEVSKQISIEQQHQKELKDPAKQFKTSFDRAMWFSEEGALKGAMATLQLPHFLHAYVLGTVWNTGREASQQVGDLFGYDWGEGWVDYDKLYLANTKWKMVSDEAESVVKSFQELHGIKNRSTAEHILTYTVDFAIPISWPAKVIKFFAHMGVNMKAMSEYWKYYDDGPEAIMRTTQTAKLETEAMQPFYERLKKAKVDKDTEEVLRVNQEIDTAREQLLGEGIKYLKGTAGKYKKMSDRWWDFRFQPRGETVMGSVSKRNPWTGKVERENVLLTNAPTRDEIEFQRQYKKLIHGMAIVSAGTTAGTWHGYFEGTEYEDFAYAAALGSIIFNPSTAMRLLELTADKFFGAITRQVPFTATRTLGGLMGMEGKLGLSIPLVIAAGAKTWYESSGRNWEEYFDTTGYKRLAAMSRGQPFYKVLALDDKEKLKMFGQETDLTALDAAIVLHGTDLKTMRKFAEYVQASMPSEYSESAQQLYLYYVKLAKRLNEIGKADAIPKWALTAEQWMGAIRAQVVETHMANAYKDGSIKNNLFGLGSPGAEGSLLNIIRISNQEAKQQIDYLKKLLDELTGGDPKLEKEFIEFKRGISAWIAKAEAKNSSAENKLKELAKGENTFFNLQKEMDLNDILMLSKQEGGVFDIENNLGLLGTGRIDPGEKLAAFGIRLRDTFDNAYEMQKQAQDFRFEDLTGNYYGYTAPGNANSFVDSLEELHKSNLDELGGLIPFLKDAGRLRAFGSTKPIERGQDQIDSVIAFARYNDLSRKSYEELLAIASDISSRTGLRNLTLSDNQYINVLEKPVFLRHTEGTGTAGSIDLRATLDNLEINLETGEPGHAATSGFENNPAEYLRLILSRLSGGTDSVARNSLKDLFNHELTIADMHTIRGSFGRWSNKRQKTSPEAAQDIHSLVRKLDDIFDELGIPIVAKANKEYTNWKTVWHETDIGQNIPKKDISENSSISSRRLNDDELLEIFLKHKNSQQSSEIFKRMFGDIQDIRRASEYGIFKSRKEAKEKIEDLIKTEKDKKFKIVKISKDEFGIIEYVPKQRMGMEVEKANLLEAMDVSLGRILWRDAGQLVSNNPRQNMEHLQRLRDNKLISKKAHEDGTRIISMYDSVSHYDISAKAANAEKTMTNLLNTISKEQSDALQKSLGVDLQKRNSEALLDIFAPPNRAFQDARAKYRSLPYEDSIDPIAYPEVIDEAGNVVYQAGSDSAKILDPAHNKLRELAFMLRKKLADNIEDEDTIPSLEQIEESLNTFSGKAQKERVDKVLEIFMKDIVGIEDVTKITSDQKKILEDLKRSLISTAIKRSSKYLNTRAPALDQAYKDLLEGIKDKVLPKWWKGDFPPISGYMSLSADIDLVIFGQFLEDLWPVISRINRITGKNQMTDDLIHIFEGLVGAKAELTTIGIQDVMGVIPRGLTMPAGLSRAYAGFRGVVSWRYLASEQIIREQQRRKSLFLYAIVTDPEFLTQLRSVVTDKRIDDEMAVMFAKKVVSIMGPRLAVYDPEKREVVNDPSPGLLIRAMRTIMHDPKKVPGIQSLLSKKEVDKKSAEDKRPFGPGFFGGSPEESLPPSPEKKRSFGSGFFQ